MKTHATDHTQRSTVAQIPPRDDVPTDALICQAANTRPQSIHVVKEMPTDAERKQQLESSSTTTDADTETQLPGARER